MNFATWPALLVVDVEGNGTNPPVLVGVAALPVRDTRPDKWAAGILDNLALGILCKAPVMGVPVAVLPYLNSDQATHPAYRRGLDLLRKMGVLIGSYKPHRPAAGGGADRYRREEVLELLDPTLSMRS